jgi:PadR family transcriptional regulator, regulatory protein PadR
VIRLPQGISIPSHTLKKGTNRFPLLTEGKLRYDARATLGYRGHGHGNEMSKPSDLLQGTLDMLLLKILALEPLNGFAVSQRLTQVSGDILQVSDGSLYPALHKLEQEGSITAEWKTSGYGRRAKYYSLTRLGQRQLQKEADNWDRLSTAISRIIKLKEV